MTEYAVFDTAIGPCGIAWNERGILAVRFAEGDETRTREKLLRRVPGATEAVPTLAVQHAIDSVVALLRGERRDLRDILIDDANTPAFNRKVYAIARQIPPGQTMTYGEIAKRLGDKLLARDVGQALGENPTPIIVPCHRVLHSGGGLGGYTGGIERKLTLLAIERGPNPDAGPSRAGS